MKRNTLSVTIPPPQSSLGAHFALSAALPQDSTPETAKLIPSMFTRKTSTEGVKPRMTM